jgi:predicted nuclease of predicted toxin-antitoxin system
VKFLADIGISIKSVTFLKNTGYRAVHLSELGLNSLSDAMILAKAKNEGFVILTHDLDFGELIAASGGVLPSVITFRLRNMKAANVNNYLDKILLSHTKDLEEGCVISVTEGQIRVRKLPI